jgi:hypothetical protein
MGPGTGGRRSERTNQMNSLDSINPVTPAEAGGPASLTNRDSRLRGNDDNS